MDEIQAQLNENQKSLISLGRRLMKNGAPWVEGDPIPKK